jgi:hypothetical protein
LKPRFLVPGTRIYTKIRKLSQTLPTFFDEPNRQLYKLHQQLDALVLQAYGCRPDDDLLGQLLTLNLALAENKIILPVAER